MGRIEEDVDKNLADKDVDKVSGLDCDGIASTRTVPNEAAGDTREVEGKSSRFICLPELERYYKKRRLTTGKTEIICQACSASLKTQEIKRLTKHVAKCRAITDEDKEYLAQVTANHPKINISSDTDSRDTLNMAWAAVMVENNIPLSSLTSESFKNFVKFACPTWKVPTPEVMAAKYINVATLRQPYSNLIPTRQLKRERNEAV